MRIWQSLCPAIRVSVYQNSNRAPLTDVSETAANEKGKGLEYLRGFIARENSRVPVLFNFGKVQ